MRLRHCTAYALGLLAAMAFGASAQAPAKPGSEYTISGPFTHQNLAIYLLHGKDTISGKKLLTLQEALQQRIVIVHETGRVGRLAVQNLSADSEVFIQAGDIVKGGRQDRVLAYDLIVPARSGRVPIAAFCVEAGRWRKRGAENASRFSQSTGQLPGRALRLAVSSARQQRQVWQKVKQQQDKLSMRLNKNVANSRSPSSLQLTLEDPDLKAKIDAYVTRLEKCIASKSNVVGFALTIRGKVEGAEVYGSSTLFRKMWPKLLRTAAVDAFSEYQQGRRYELAENDEIHAFLADGLHGKLVDGKQVDTNVSRRIKVTSRQTQHTFFIESRDQAQRGAVLHRTFIAR